MSYYKIEKDNLELDYKYVKNVALEEYDLNIKDFMGNDIDEDTQVEFGLNTLMLSYLVNEGLEDTFSTEDIITGQEKSDGSYCKIIDVKFLLKLSNNIIKKNIPKNEYGIDAIYVDKRDKNQVKIKLFSYKVPKINNRNKPMSQETLSSINVLLTSLEKQEKISGNIYLEEVQSLIKDNYSGKINLAIEFYMINLGKKYEKIVETALNNIVKNELVENLFVYSLDEIATLFKSVAERAINVKDIDFKKNEALLSNSQKDTLILVLPFRKMLKLFSIKKDENGIFKIPDNLFSTNVRKFLDSNTNYNRGMYETLKTFEGKENFYKYNNGITVVCDSLNIYEHHVKSDEYQEQDYLLRCNIKNLRIVNGAQTISTLVKVLNDNSEKEYQEFYDSELKIMIRLFDTQNNPMISNDISRYTNSQNPISDMDLRSLERVHYVLKQNLEHTNEKFVYLHKKGSKIEANNLKKQGKEVITMQELGNLLWVIEDPVAARSQKKKIWKYHEDSKKDLHDKIFHDKLSVEEIIENWFLNKKVLDVAKELKKEGETAASYAVSHVLYELKKRQILSTSENIDELIRQAYERNLSNFYEYKKNNSKLIYAERKYFQTPDSKKKVDEYLEKYKKDVTNENK